MEEGWFPCTGQPSLLRKAAFKVQRESWAAVGDERPGKRPKGGEEGWSKKRGQRMSEGDEESQGEEEGAWETLV